MKLYPKKGKLIVIPPMKKHSNSKIYFVFLILKISGLLYFFNIKMYTAIKTQPRNPVCE